jgi:hypothetical protein
VSAARRARRARRLGGEGDTDTDADSAWWPYDAAVVECSSYQLVRRLVVREGDDGLHSLYRHSHYYIPYYIPFCTPSHFFFSFLFFPLFSSKSLYPCRGAVACKGNDGWSRVSLPSAPYRQEHPGVLRFDAACVINLTPDHLERHGSMDAYAAVGAAHVDSPRPIAERAPGTQVVWFQPLHLSSEKTPVSRCTFHI